MKALIALAVLICLAIPAAASEMYVAYLPDSSLAASPNVYSHKFARYAAGVLLDKNMQAFTPRLKIDTLMDKTNDDGSFSPTSVRYEVGVEYRTPLEGLFLDASRNCWHTIDGYGTQDYWQIKAGYRF